MPLLVIVSLIWLLLPLWWWPSRVRQALAVPDIQQAFLDLWRATRGPFWLYALGLGGLGMAMGKGVWATAPPLVVDALSVFGGAVLVLMGSALTGILQAPFTTRWLDRRVTWPEAALRSATRLLMLVGPMAVYLWVTLALGPQWVAGHLALWIAVSIAGGIVMEALSPWAARLMLRTTWPDEALSARWDVLRRRAGIGRVSFVLWPGRRDRVANAFATGLYRPLIAVSDYLVDRLPPAELDAVIGHELGHVKHRHAWGGLMGIVGGVVLVTSFVILPRAWVIGLFALAVPWTIWWLSYWQRRAEFSADAFYDRVGVSPATTAQALATLGTLTPFPPTLPRSVELTMSHPSLAHRIERLTRAAQAETTD